MADRDKEHQNKLKALMAKKMKASLLRGPTRVQIPEDAQDSDDPFAEADARANEEQAADRGQEKD